jgi:hypothetical protein
MATEVLQPQLPRAPYYSSSSLRRSKPSKSSLFRGSAPSHSGRHARSEPPVHDISPIPRTASSPSLLPSQPIDINYARRPRSAGFSSGRGESFFTDYDLSPDDALSFPSYEQVDYINPDDQDDHDDQGDGPAPPSSPHEGLTDDSPSIPSDDLTPLPTPEINFVLAEDDTAIKQAPSRHVDYLSHDWKEEDIWSSWKHIVSNRKVYGERSRLENASWRTWAKQRQKLKTVPPDSLNW